MNNDIIDVEGYIVDEKPVSTTSIKKSFDLSLTDDYVIMFRDAEGELFLQYPAFIGLSDGIKIRKGEETYLFKNVTDVPRERPRFYRTPQAILKAMLDTVSAYEDDTKVYPNPNNVHIVLLNNVSEPIEDALFEAINNTKLKYAEPKHDVYDLEGLKGIQSNWEINNHNNKLITCRDLIDKINNIRNKYNNVKSESSVKGKSISDIMMS